MDLYNRATIISRRISGGGGGIKLFLKMKTRTHAQEREGKKGRKRLCRDFVPLRGDSPRLRNRDPSQPGKRRAAFEKQSLAVATRFAVEWTRGLLPQAIDANEPPIEPRIVERRNEGSGGPADGTRVVVLQELAPQELRPERMSSPLSDSRYSPEIPLDQVQPLRRDLPSVYWNVRSPLCSPRRTVTNC